MRLKRRIAAIVLMAWAAGCGGSTASPLTIPPDDQSGSPPAGARPSGTPLGSGTGAPSPTTSRAAGEAIVSSADSITAEPGGRRSDPEGVAPASEVTRLSWFDSRHAPRTMTLGGYLYEYAFSFDDGKEVVERTANDRAYGHPGFGYVVSHALNGNSPIGKQFTPGRVETVVLTGGHHAIHRVELTYDRDAEDGGDGVRIPVVIEWVVATGRDHPIWAVTWRAGDIANPQGVEFDTYRMDVRGPYGTLNFDGASGLDDGDAIGGVAWGDFGLRFGTTDNELTLQSPWTYTAANSVAFTRAWTATANGEMGIVESRPGDREMGYPDRVVGRERGATSARSFSGKGDCSGFEDRRRYVLPCVTGWPYQLMNYDWDPSSTKPPDEATGTKLIAWGSPYGWLGASSFDLFDYSGTADGRGDRSYAAFIVLGPKDRFHASTGTWEADGDVEHVIRQVEAYAAARITNVIRGRVLEDAPRGPGATQRKPLANGYNDTYAAYALEADSNAVAFTLAPAEGLPVERPIFILSHYTGRDLPRVRVAGVDQRVNNGTATSGAWVSLNEETDELWVTLHADLSAPTEIEITAPDP